MSDDFKHLFTSTSGVNHSMKLNADGSLELRAAEDVDSILEWNKAARNHNDGYSKSRELRRVARIPITVAMKWFNEEGWWYQDPNAKNKLYAKLNSSEYAHLRTADGHV